MCMEDVAGFDGGHRFVGECGRWDGAAGVVYMSCAEEGGPGLSE